MISNADNRLEDLASEVAAMQKPYVEQICIDLETEMSWRDPVLIVALREKFNRIEILRSQIWTE